jgi:hypothetical protein
MGIGICLEILNHVAIDRFGKVSICVKCDPKRLIKDERKCFL